MGYPGSPLGNLIAPQGAQGTRRSHQPRRCIVVENLKDLSPPQAQKPHSTITVSEEQVGLVRAFIEQHPSQKFARFRPGSVVYHVLQDAMIRKYDIDQWMYIATDLRAVHLDPNCPHGLGEVRLQRALLGDSQPWRR